jgi:hypothetical protein
MNIELEDVVVQDFSDDALELAAGGALRAKTWFTCAVIPGDPYCY